LSSSLSVAEAAERMKGEEEEEEEEDVRGRWRERSVGGLAGLVLRAK
jgi:hypothetical protein